MEAQEAKFKHVMAKLRRQIEAEKPKDMIKATLEQLRTEWNDWIAVVKDCITGMKNDLNPEAEEIEKKFFIGRFEVTKNSS